MPSYSQPARATDPGLKTSDPRLKKRREPDGTEILNSHEKPADPSGSVPVETCVRTSQSGGRAPYQSPIEDSTIRVGRTLALREETRHTQPASLASGHPRRHQDNQSHRPIDSESCNQSLDASQSSPHALTPHSDRSPQGWPSMPNAPVPVRVNPWQFFNSQGTPVNRMAPPNVQYNSSSTAISQPRTSESNRDMATMLSDTLTEIKHLREEVVSGRREIGDLRTEMQSDRAKLTRLRETFDNARGQILAGTQRLQTTSQDCSRSLVALREGLSQEMNSTRKDVSAVCNQVQSAREEMDGLRQIVKQEFDQVQSGIQSHKEAISECRADFQDIRQKQNMDENDDVQVLQATDPGRAPKRRKLISDQVAVPREVLMNLLADRMFKAE